MKPHLLLLTSAALVTLSFTPVASAEEASDSARPPYTTPSEVKSWQEGGTPVTFLDVRESDEFEAGHLPGAMNIAFDKVEGLADTLPHDKPLVIYCIHSAHRAPEAAKTLRRLGVDNAYVLEGGIAAWEAGGLTIHASDMTKAPHILPVTERCENKPAS
ncbi:MAG: rhodanese-like domain-containing protein [Candidatus Omnitrophica bacterium]|nr:rhodanese-like domain-containing protein [Candidatus Omnitrophota bacterium]